jgi:Penicillinase repressor
MRILKTKGYLKKRRQDRAFVYRSAQAKSKIIGGMIREFTDRVFNGGGASGPQVGFACGLLTLPRVRLRICRLQPQPAVRMLA